MNVKPFTSFFTLIRSRSHWGSSRDTKKQLQDQLIAMKKGEKKKKKKNFEKITSNNHIITKEPKKMTIISKLKMNKQHVRLIENKGKKKKRKEKKMKKKGTHPPQKMRKKNGGKSYHLERKAAIFYFLQMLLIGFLFSSCSFLSPFSQYSELWAQNDSERSTFYKISSFNWSFTLFRSSVGGSHPIFFLCNNNNNNNYKFTTNKFND